MIIGKTIITRLVRSILYGLFLLPVLLLRLQAQTTGTLSLQNSIPTGTGLINLQKNIFTPTCAMPACHDGMFEPDFRTAQSSYATTVYHAVIKNDTGHMYKYRVLPFKPEESVLYKRLTTCCFVNVNDRMPFTVGDTLSASQIQMVYNWIKEGAKNITGQISEPPASEQPLFDGYFNFVTVASKQKPERTERFGPNIISNSSDTLIVSTTLKNPDKIYPARLQCFFQLYKHPDYSDTPVEYSALIISKDIKAAIPLNTLANGTTYYARLKFIYMQQNAYYLPYSEMEFCIRQVNSFLVPERK